MTTLTRKMDTDTLSVFGERTRAMYRMIGFAPTDAQAKILASPARNILVTGGIQAGKSLIAAKKVVKEFPNDLARAIARAKDTGVPVSQVLPIIYWLVGADYDATEREFRYLEYDFSSLGLLRRPSKRINPGTLDILGGSGRATVIAKIRTKSAKDAQTLRKEAPSGIIPCEASQLDLTALERLIERQAPAQAWLFMTGTMEQGHPWYAQLAKQWGISGPDKAWFQLRSSTNPYIYPGGEENPELVRQRQEMPESLYAERFEGIPQIPTGLVFPEFQPDLHVFGVEYEPGLQVQVWEDPGYGSTSAHVLLAVQIVDGQIRVVDEVYERGMTTEVIIRDILRQKPWYRDVEVRVHDPHYSTQHHATDSVDEIWRRMEPQVRTVGERIRVNPRLERTRGMLLPTAYGKPKTVIHPKCEGLLSEVGLCLNPLDRQEHVYRYRTDRDGNVVGDEPVDEWNHAWEAFGRGAYWNFGPIGDTARSGKKRFRSQFFTRLGRERGKSREI